MDSILFVFSGDLWCYSSSAWDIIDAAAISLLICMSRFLARLFIWSVFCLELRRFMIILSALLISFSSAAGSTSPSDTVKFSSSTEKLLLCLLIWAAFLLQWSSTNFEARSALSFSFTYCKSAFYSLYFGSKLLLSSSSKLISVIFCRGAYCVLVDLIPSHFAFKLRSAKKDVGRDSSFLLRFSK